MSVDVAALGIDRLSVGERLELIELIWDSLPEQVSTSELPAEHLAELKKRRAAVTDQPGIGKPWREVLDSFEN
jgi:putative addiction module component (TIGR02574 family)